MNTIDDIGYWLLSIAVLVAVAFTRPTQARCARGWWLATGVRASGDYACHELGTFHEKRTERGGWTDDSPAPSARIESRVYCTNGTQPIVVDGVEVSCQHGGWK